MRNYSGIIPALLFIAVILTMGCTSQTATPPSVPAPAPTTPVPATASQPVIATPSTIPTLAAVTTTTEVISVTTPLPQPDPADVSKITFSYYSDSDFSVEYPSTWSTETSIFTPYPVGPFYLYDDPRLNEPYRVVTITSPDNTKKFVALTQDFESAGSLRLNPTIAWCKAMFQRDYRDLSAANYLGNFRYFSTGNAMASSYDVVLPERTRYYPSAYSIKAVVTQRHAYYFGFFTDTGNFSRYRNLKDIVISSVKTADAL